MTTRQNPPPTLKDVIEARVLQALARINCISIGTIQSFDETNQTANISINYQRIIKSATASAKGLPADQILPYPILVQCPVIVMNGGGATMTFPIRQGDTCLLLFCDREIDTWFNTGTANNPPNSERVHDLCDAIALIGPFSLKNKLSGYDTNSVKIYNGGGYVKIDMSGNIEVHGGNITISGGAVVIEGSTVSINP